jgi:hypothetical protein
MNMTPQTSLALLLALGLVGCTPKAKPVEPTPQPAAAVVTLLRLENGDRACYVVVKTAEGVEESMEGDFELCEGGQNSAASLLGRKITYTTKKAKVLAASCEGDMDCGKSDEVDLVVSVTAVE